MAMWGILLLLAGLASSSQLCQRGVVVELDGSNFDLAISECRNILVDFYAPWCSHCIALAPKLDEAAMLLRGSNEELTLAKINADKFTTKHKINEYPTLKLFVDGIPRDYKGPHDPELMVAHLRRMLAPALSILSSPSAVKQFVELAGDTLPIFIGFGVDESAFDELAQQHGQRAWFAAVDEENSKSMSSDYELSSLPALIVKHNSQMEEAVIYGPFKEHALASFVRHNLFPAVTNLTYESLDLVKEDGRPIVLAIVISAPSAVVSGHLKDLARLHPELLFALLESSSPLAEIFHTSKLLVWDGDRNFYTSLHQKEWENEEEMAGHLSLLVEDFKNENVKRHIVKQPSFLQQFMGFIGQNVLYIVLFFVTIVAFLQTMDWKQPGANR